MIKLYFFCKKKCLSASIPLWVCDDKAIFSRDLDNFVYGVSSNVRRMGVKLEQKRPCTLCSKCYYGVHNDPRLLRFSTQILYLNSFPFIWRNLIWIFSNRGHSISIQPLFFRLRRAPPHYNKLNSGQKYYYYYYVMTLGQNLRKGCPGTLRAIGDLLSDPSIF